MVHATSKRFIHTNYLARQKVKGQAARARKTSAMAVTLGMLLMLCFFVFIWVRIYVLELGYRMSKVMQQHEQLLEENKKLRIERASLIAPSRIERVARTELGMVVPKNDQVVVLSW